MEDLMDQMEDKDEEMKYRGQIHGFYDQSQDRLDDIDKMRGSNRRWRNRHYNQSRRRNRD